MAAHVGRFVDEERRTRPLFGRVKAPDERAVRFARVMVELGGVASGNELAAAAGLVHARDGEQLFIHGILGMPAAITNPIETHVRGDAVQQA